MTTIYETVVEATPGTQVVLYPTTLAQTLTLENLEVMPRGTVLVYVDTRGPRLCRLMNVTRSGNVRIIVPGLKTKLIVGHRALLLPDADRHSEVI